MISAKYIWLRAGMLIAGNSTNPFQHKLDIYINGSSTDPTFVIDPKIAANKFMVVTARLALYGPIPTTTWTRLTAKATAGDTQIHV